MYQPQTKWIEAGDDSSSLMWGHLKVGEVTLGAGGWYAYYRADNRNERMTNLKDFPAIDLARRAVERALTAASGSPIAPRIRCSECDNGVQEDWTYCPFCGSQGRTEKAA